MTFQRSPLFGFLLLCNPCAMNDELSNYAVSLSWIIWIVNVLDVARDSMERYERGMYDWSQEFVSMVLPNLH